MNNIPDYVQEDIMSFGYEVLAKLGEGAMGAVYKVKKKGGSAFYALKATPKSEGDTIAELRFWSEWEIGQNHNFNNILRTFEAFESKYFWCLIMDYVDGESLLERCGCVQLLDAIELLRPLAASIDELHSQKVIHRDIKPSNIMINKEEEVFLIDFGIHKTLEGHETQAGQMMGTVLYMAPEQIDARNVTKYADQYSFALTLFALIYGGLPWGKNKVFGEIFLIKSLKINPVIMESNLISKALKPCWLKVLNPEPSKRYESCSEFLNDMHRRMTGEDPLEPLLDMMPSVSQNLLWRIVLSFVAVCFLVGAYSFFLNEKSLHPARQIDKSNKILLDFQTNFIQRLEVSEEILQVYQRDKVSAGRGTKTHLRYKKIVLEYNINRKEYREKLEDVFGASIYLWEREIHHQLFYANRNIECLIKNLGDDERLHKNAERHLLDAKTNYDVLNAFVQDVIKKKTGWPLPTTRVKLPIFQELAEPCSQ